MHSALSTGEEDHALSAAASEQEEVDDSQIAEPAGDIQEQEKVLEQQGEAVLEVASASALSAEKHDVEAPSGNQRSVPGVLSVKQPLHTSAAQTSDSQRVVRRRKKKADPSFVY